MIRAVAYYRMSDGKQEQSIPGQRHEVQAYAAKHGYCIVREYADEAISGDETEKRIQFQRMLKDAKDRGDFKVVLCWDQDRFGRFDPLEAGYWIKPLRDAGVRLETVAQGRIDWEDFAGRIIYAVQQEGKHQFLRDLSRNETRGKLRVAREGKWNGGKPPYGYTVEGHRLVPGDPAEVAVVKELFLRYAAGTVSLRGLATDLTRRGIPSPCGAAWSNGVVRKILRHPVYLGDTVWNRRHEGKYCGVAAGEIIAETRAGRHYNPEADYIIKRGTHEALTDRDTFERVQRRLMERQNACAPSPTDPYSLSGLVMCANCGAVMHGATMRRGARMYRHYICSTYNLLGKPHCSHNRMEEAPLLSCIVRRIQQECQIPANRAELRERLRQKLGGAETPDNTAQLRREIASLDRRIDQGQERYLSAPAALAPGLLAKLQQWTDERNGLHAQLADVQAGADSALATLDEQVARAIALLSQLQDVLKRADPARVRAVVGEMVVRVDCWFRQVQAAKYLRSHFDHGLIRLRKDLTITRPDVHALAWTPEFTA
jgi:site-specific DNA recombinase